MKCCSKLVKEVIKIDVLELIKLRVDKSDDFVDKVVYLWNHYSELSKEEKTLLDTLMQKLER